MYREVNLFFSCVVVCLIFGYEFDYNGENKENGKEELLIKVEEIINNFVVGWSG